MTTEKLKLSDKRVIVALTGRVDSAVAAFLLKKQGYDVIGLAIVVGNKDLTKNESDLPKCYIDNLDKIKNFCESIKIPFYATDIKSEYDYEVVDRLVDNKLSGFANSSCFDCSRLRMNTLFSKMKALDADFIATGHYCKVYENLNSNEYFVHSNNTTEVDQSVFLTGLRQEVLKHLILPLGELRKEEVLKIAKNFKLQVSDSKKAENFCFRTNESIENILKKRVPKSLIQEGVMINKATESIYGDHKGLVYHYIGQENLETSSGLKIDKNLQVVAFDHKKSFLYLGPSTNLAFKGAQIINLSVSKRLDKRKPLHCYIKFKYSNQYISTHLYFKNNGSGYIDFDEIIYPLLVGEQIIFYDTDKRNSKIIGSASVRKRGVFMGLDRVVDYRPREVKEEGADDKDIQDSFYFKF